MKHRNPYRHTIRSLIVLIVCLSVFLPVFAQQDDPCISDPGQLQEASDSDEQTLNTDTEITGPEEETPDTDTAGPKEQALNTDTEITSHEEQRPDTDTEIIGPEEQTPDTEIADPKEQTLNTDTEIADPEEQTQNTDTALSGPEEQVLNTDTETAGSSRYPLSALKLQKKTFTYTGEKIRPSVTVTASVNGRTKELIAGTDYKISYADNENAGIAAVTVKGRGNYRGTLCAYFTIKPAKLKSAELLRTVYVYNGSAKKPKALVKASVNGSIKKLNAGRDYSIQYVRNKSAGKAKAIIKGKGNYTGTIKKSFRIRLEKAQILSASVSGKNLSLKWKKCTTPISGYQIEYSTDRTFTSDTHSVQIRKRSAASYTLKKPASQKTYYFRIRTYKNTGKKIICSLWSAVKTVTMPNTKNKKEPGMLTIIDDDGRLSFLKKWLPIIKEKGISISTAIAPYKMATQPGRYMSWEQVQTCADAGAEILCHTLMHRLNNETAGMSVSAIRSEYKEAQRIMKEHGYAEGSRILVYSGSTGSLANARSAAASVFDCAIACSGNVTNHAGANPYYLRRYQISRDYGCNLSSMKKLIDDTLKNGGWMIWIFHSYEGSLNKDRLNNVSKAIDYALDQGLPIVSASEGYERFLCYK